MCVRKYEEALYVRRKTAGTNQKQQVNGANARNGYGTGNGCQGTQDAPVEKELNTQLPQVYDPDDFYIRPCFALAHDRHAFGYTPV